MSQKPSLNTVLFKTFHLHFFLNPNHFFTKSYHLFPLVNTVIIRVLYFFRNFCKKRPYSLALTSFKNPLSQTHIFLCVLVQPFSSFPFCRLNFPLVKCQKEQTCGNPSSPHFHIFFIATYLLSLFFFPWETCLQKYVFLGQCHPFLENEIVTFSTHPSTHLYEPPSSFLLPSSK